MYIATTISFLSNHIYNHVFIQIRLLISSIIRCALHEKKGTPAVFLFIYSFILLIFDTSGRYDYDDLDTQYVDNGKDNMSNTF